MRVLVATDGSEWSDKAIELAASIQWPSETEIRVATVIEPLEPVLYAAWLTADPDSRSYDEAAVKEVHAIFENGARVLSHTGAHVTPCTLRGWAASAIVAEAEAFRADLIIVGSRGHGTIASALLGSVSAEVADLAPCPVLVARGTRLTRAVLAVDGSEFGRSAEEVVERWPIFGRVAIEATNVTDTMPVAGALALGHYAVVPEDVEDRAAADHRRVADETVARLQDSSRTAVAVLARGAPAFELMRIATDHQADLIILGTHGRTGIKRALLGSVAHNVLIHAKCSVLVVRRREPEMLGAVA